MFECKILNKDKCINEIKIKNIVYVNEYLDEEVEFECKYHQIIEDIDNEFKEYLKDMVIPLYNKTNGNLDIYTFIKNNSINFEKTCIMVEDFNNEIDIENEKIMEEDEEYSEYDEINI